MRVRRSAARTARTAFPADPFKVGASRGPRRLPSTSARSTNLACAKRPRTRTRHRSRGFAASVRRPTLFRPPLPKEEGLDRAASVRSSRPGAPCHAPLVDFCNRNDPQARPTGLRNPTPRSGRSTFIELRILEQVPLEEWSGRVSSHRSAAREPRIHGSGAACRAEGSRHPLRPLSPRLLVVKGLPQPDRLSDTSCRTARSHAGWSHRHAPEWASKPASFWARRRAREPLPRFPDASEHLRAAGQGRLPHPSAKRRCVPPHPRCLPSRDPPCGECRSPQLVTNLWNRARAFSISAPCRARTVRGGAATRPHLKSRLPLSGGPPLPKEQRSGGRSASFDFYVSSGPRPDEIGRAHV